MKTQLNQKLEQVVDAVAFYRKTGKHRQVSFRYNPEVRTAFDFSAWKHERDSDAVRSILPEDIMVSTEGNMFVVGKDNRYNLKQFITQYPQHMRSYRLDRIQID
jgi:ABC-type Fe3+ transport system substrate-binding protein